MSNFVQGGCVRVDGVKGNVACVPAVGADTVVVVFADGGVREVPCCDVVRTKGRPKAVSAMIDAMSRLNPCCSIEVAECDVVCETACDETSQGESCCDNEGDALDCGVSDCCAAE